MPGLRVQQLGGPGSLVSVKTRGLRNQDTFVLIDGLRFRDPATPQGDATASCTLPLSDTRRLCFFGKVENVFDRNYYENGFRTPGANARAGAALHF